MNSNHPITEEILRANILSDLRSHNVDEALVDGDTLINIEFLATDLMDYARKFAASELRAAAGEDDIVPLLNYDKHERVDLNNAINHGVRSGRNELRRTLRVRADELEANNNVA